MALAYLIDENLRGTLASAIARAAVRHGFALDVVQVGDLHVPPRETPDADLLLWAEAADRLLISHDRTTLAGHLADHLAAGHHSSGIVLLRPGRLSHLAEYLVLMAFATDPDEWRDRITYVP